MRIKIIRSGKNYRVGQVLVMDSVLAYKLIKHGIAEATKDMMSEDYKIHGHTSRKRSHNRR